VTRAPAKHRHRGGDHRAGEQHHEHAWGQRAAEQPADERADDTGRSEDYPDTPAHAARASVLQQSEGARRADDEQ
jgi:hypothetical protein